MTVSVESLVRHIRQTYPHWPEATVQEAARRGVGIFSKSPTTPVASWTIENPQEWSRKLLSQDAILCCKMCGFRLFACKCTCRGEDCSLLGCGFTPVTLDPAPLKQALSSLPRERLAALSNDALKRSITIDGSIVVDGHHRIAKSIEKGLSLSAVEIPGQASCQLEWNRMLVTERPTCSLLTGK